MEKGIYIGHYEYVGKRLPASMLELRTRFKIDITESREGSFSGTVTDDEKSGGMPGLGSVQGEAAGDGISFVKQMPRMGMMTRDGKMKMFKQKHSPIYYQGRNRGKGQFAGTWNMKLRFRLFGLIPIPLGTTEGSWEMAKEVS